MYARTTDGWVAAYESAKWMAKEHKIRFVLLVHKRHPDRYIISRPNLVKADDVEVGTVANFVDQDGNMEPAF